MTKTGCRTIRHQTISSGCQIVRFIILPNCPTIRKRAQIWNLLIFHNFVFCGNYPVHFPQIQKQIFRSTNSNTNTNTDILKWCCLWQLSGAFPPIRTGRSTPSSPFYPWHRLLIPKHCEPAMCNCTCVCTNYCTFTNVILCSCPHQSPGGQLNKWYCLSCCLSWVRFFLP